MARARGYADWNPKEDTVILLGQVNNVLDDLRAYLPLTARQIFYRLVAKYRYPKTDKEYNNLCEKLVRARRAQLIPFGAIRDDKITRHVAGTGYGDPAEFWEDVPEFADYYGRRTRQGQHFNVELWTEGRGPSGMVAQWAQPYGISVFSAGGFPSVTATHAIAQRALRARPNPTIMLHLGDYDPSGESIFEAMMTDAMHFFGGEVDGGQIDGDKLNFGLGDDFRALRLALTEEQIKTYGVETAPPKKTDGRSPKWIEEGRTETAELEAIDPPVLKEIVERACEDWTDMPQLAAVAEEADEERVVIERRFREFSRHVQEEIEQEEAEDDGE